MCIEVIRTQFLRRLILAAHGAKAAKGHGTNRILGTAPLYRENFGPHAERKADHTDAEETRSEKMPEFMEKNDKAKE